MNALAKIELFDFEDAPVRVVMLEDKPHWVATDLANILGYSHVPNMIRMLHEDQKGVHLVNTLGGEQSVTIVTEGGMWTCVIRSKRPEAKRFVKWLTDVLLPTLRQTGQFVLNDNGPVQTVLDEPGMPEFAERVRVGLQLVREARLVFGLEAARRAWTLSGLPDVSATPLPPALSNANTRQVSAWLEERIEMKTGHREGATRLYMDFARWCDDGDETAIGIRRWAEAMFRLGIAKTKASGIQYLDVMLKAD